MSETPATDSFFASYRILSRLGYGGMGEVFLAEDTVLNRRVALKLLPAEFARHQLRLKRFEQEAQAVSALNHPNILTIHEFGTQNGAPFIVMEFVEGVTLRERLRDGGLSINEALHVAAQVSSALAASHEAGIVHRDIKPENIMIRRDGIVKVLDFGLAKLVNEDSDRDGDDSVATQLLVNTNPGALLGTPNYMSPEQACGQEVDSRTDIFSLGVVLYEMLTGQRPFEGASPVEVMSSILRDDPVDLIESNPKITPALQRIVSACLEKKPDRRFHSAHDLGFALAAISSSSSSSLDDAFHVPVYKKVRKTTDRERMVRFLAVTLAALATIIASLSVWQLRRAANTSRTFQQMTFRNEAIFQARFAPDGQTVVYGGATENNTPEIFTVHPDFPAPQSIGTRGMNLLDVSSKAELVILTDSHYVWHRMFRRTLARMPLVGGAPREILREVRQAVWSPDGSQPAIIREVDGKDRLEYPIGKVLYQVDGYLSDLQISSDGQHIAFFEHPRKWDDRGSVNVVSLDGRNSVITDGYWSERGLAWSPDGREVWFSASVSGGNYIIYAVTLAGRRRIVDQSPGGLILQSVAPDGRWLASRVDFRYAATVHLPGAVSDRDLSWLRTSHSRELTQDGKKLLFMETSAGKNYTVCLRKTDGSPLVQLGRG